MHIFKNPSWIDRRLLSLNRIEDLPESLFYEINKNLGALQDGEPLVSVVIPAYNEELNIVRTMHSLSRNRTSFGVEFIVVDNNSTDRTAEMLRRMNVIACSQKKQGCGPARQLGQETARGKYILTADADCLYPPDWIRVMVERLKDPSVSCVYGRYSFLGSPDKPRWKFFCYELLRDLYAELRHLKRPFMNALGMSMGYVREYGLKAAFIDRNIRGEDGRMCFSLMQYGRVKQIRDTAVRVWTYPRTLDRDGRLIYALGNRIANEMMRFTQYFTRQPQHDVHISENSKRRTFPGFRKRRDVRKKTKEPV